MILTCTLTTVVEYHTFFELQGFPIPFWRRPWSLFLDAFLARTVLFLLAIGPLACARRLAQRALPRGVVRPRTSGRGLESPWKRQRGFL